MVMPSLGRTLKALAGMAAGRWLVSTQFVDDCKEAQGLAEPVSCWVVLMRVWHLTEVSGGAEAG